MKKSYATAKNDFSNAQAAAPLALNHAPVPLTALRMPASGSRGLGPPALRWPRRRGGHAPGRGGQRTRPPTLVPPHPRSGVAATALDRGDRQSRGVWECRHALSKPPDPSLTAIATPVTGAGSTDHHKWCFKPLFVFSPGAGRYARPGRLPAKRPARAFVTLD